MRTLSLRAALQGLAVLAFAAIPPRSQGGSCQGDVDWYRLMDEASGLMITRLSRARCISLGFASECTKSWVPGQFWNWTVRRCGAEGAPDCCTVLQHHSDGLGVRYSTTWSCPACNEAEKYQLETNLLYSSTEDGVTKFNKDTVAVCSG